MLIFRAQDLKAPQNYHNTSNFQARIGTVSGAYTRLLPHVIG
jgi:hypothetical protein